MRIGIFFGGPAREREISYAGGKTAYENMDKALFTPVLVFVDSLGNFILTDESTLYHSGIRAFYPGPAFREGGFEVYIESLQQQLSPAELEALMHGIGTPIQPQDFKKYFDFAFIILHGPDCEDGAIQGLMEWHKMPYMGPGLLGSAVSIDKILQNEQIARANGQEKKMAVVRWEEWHGADISQKFEEAKAAVGLPIVVKAPHQGSSIGVAIVKEDSADAFAKAVNQCFFSLEIRADDWRSWSEAEKHTFAQRIGNLDESIGYPVVIQETQETIYHPLDLLDKLDASLHSSFTLLSINAEDQVLLEEFMTGQEFSCGVIQDNDGTVIALPPTEIAKMDENQTFDFKTKYKLNVTRKFIPVRTALENNQKIQYNIALVFEKLGMNAVARIDGFLTPDGRVLLHDPNTLPGMSPTSLIFKQMAEIGLDVTHAITYLIRQSLRERIRTGKDTIHLRKLLSTLDADIAQKLAERTLQNVEFEATTEAYMEARRTFSQLSASGKVKPTAVLKISDDEKHELPVGLLFKDTIEDVLEMVAQPVHPLITETREKAKNITRRFVG
ncbi:D-alanine--D-alanine ligase family protein [Runella slithyformis]|uniref:D-alanine--D-alanine ligase n=1 Tax=Runella slithyformis (strain ATCC 29530 / DSM 19594 / LMG 11500 / NCIMB 11436 / LSU 4) TaxID=761193 RepID=A0A7U4E6P4_RUNSL|nr:D-alanine--D-alanine ligase [Runella slithyformis]AEI49539.1 D-alanine--D-alanine ligase [Runella slithyformis DSM 19594]